MSKIVKIVLAISLLLNIGLAAMGGSFIYKKHQHKKYIASIHGGHGPETNEIRAKMREKFGESRGEIKNKFRAARQAHTALVHVLSADKFDPAAYADAANALLRSQSDMMRLKIKMTGDIAENLPDEERKVMAKHLSGMLVHKKPRRKHDERRRDGYPPDIDR